MHERVEAGTPETPEPAAVPRLRGMPIAERMLALQRTAGNAAVTRLIARQEATTGLFGAEPSEFVFILGAKDDEALETAKQHYRSALMSSPFRKVVTRDDMADPTLNGIFGYLARYKSPIHQITLVIHGNHDGVLSVPLNSADKDERTTPDELEKALHEGVLTPLNEGQITARTRIRLQACFAGHGPRMVNLLDKAFGEGWGTVIAPTVEVAYAKDVWHSEGISGWWVASPRPLNEDELAMALKAKYAASVGELDVSTYQEDAAGHHKGERMKDEDAKWAELARQAPEETTVLPDGRTQWFYVANAFVQKVRPGYEEDEALYRKSFYYYMPEEL